jgi:acyl-CoA thioesterase-1
MSQVFMSRAVPIVLVLTALICTGCGQPDTAAAEGGRPAGTTADAAPATATTTGRASSPRPSSSPRIVFLGDSLTAGYGLAKEESVPSLIAARLRNDGFDYDVVNAGVSGDTSAGGLSRLDWSLEGDVRVLIIELGGNDGLRGLPVESLRQNLTEIITRAKRRGIKVVLTGMEAPPNFGAAYTAEFRRVYRDLAKEHEVTFVPFFLEGVAGNPALNIADGIHPNAEGARIVERTIWAALAPLLDKSAARSATR